MNFSDTVQELFLSRRLLRAVGVEHAFLRTVDSHGDVLYDPDVVRLSMLRYELIWMPILVNSPVHSPPVPPLDIAFMWHCHVLCPTRC